MLKFRKALLKSSTCFVDSPGGQGGGGTSPGSSGGSSGNGGGQSSSAPSGDASTSTSGGTQTSPSPGGTQPSPAPTGPDSSPGPEPVGDNFFDLSGLDELSEGDEDDTQPSGGKPGVQPQQPAPTQQQPPAPQTPAPAAQQPAPAQTAPTQQPSQAGPQGATPQIPSPAEPGKIAEAMMANFADISNHLASTPDFQLSKEDLEGLETDVGGTISKAMARTHVRAVAAAMSQIARTVPLMITKQISVMRKNMERENSFYSSWPGIDRAKHGELVNGYAKTYRSMNPGASFEDMVKNVGPMVMIAAGIPQQQQAPGGRQQPNSPMRNGRTPPSPFVPAQAGGGGAPPQPQAPDPWSGLQGSQEDEE